MRTLYRHEPDTWTKISEIPLLEDPGQASRYCDYLAGYIDSFIHSRKPEVNGKLPFFAKSYAAQGRHLLFKASVLLSAGVSRINNNVRLPVVRPIAMGNLDDSVVVWKSIQLLGRMGVITRCQDGAKGIQIVRHPCGYIASVLSGESNKKFISYVPASEDYPLYEKILQTEQSARYGLTMEGLRALSPVERLAWRWVLFNEKAMDDTRGNSNVCVLKYEDMCARPIETAKKYFEFCQLEWCQQTNDFLSDSTNRDSDSYYSVFKNPEKSANKWRQMLTNEQIRQVEDIVIRSAPGRLYSDSF